MPITGAVISDANDLDKIIDEISKTRTTERGAGLMINVLKQQWRIENKDIFRL